MPQEADKINPGFWYLFKGKLRYCSINLRLSQGIVLALKSGRINTPACRLSNDKWLSHVRSRKWHGGGRNILDT